MKHLFYLLALIGLVSCNNSVNISIVNPNVEQQIYPQALATAQPRFSWQYETTETNVVQQDYRIIVASTMENAQKGFGDLWDSGVTASSQMLYIPYAGKALQNRDKAYWKVITTVTAEGKKAKVESEVKSFEISLLNQDDWQAKWIGHEFEDDVLVGKTRLAARYLRKEFALKSEVSEARLYVSGMGVYSAYLNGQEIAPEELLKPTLSWYSKRVYFNTYDVTKMLQQGNNAVGIILEGGRYTSLRYNAANPNWDGTEHVFGFGTPRLLLQLEVTYKDGQKETIVSDETWKITNRGPIRTANEWDGETYNANFDLGNWNQAEYDDSAWLQAELVEAPEGQLSAQPNPNIKVMEWVQPHDVFKKGDKWIIDMGQNMVGVLYVESKHFADLECGDTVMFRYAETLNSDSTLFMENLRSAECTDYYIADKAPANDWWKPMFVYHGFRYVEITGLQADPPSNITNWGFTGLTMYDEMPMTGEFITSNEIVNAVYRNATWGIRGNYRSMPTDCPQRDERMGWTGDRTTGNYGESYIFNNHQLYAKWLTDAEDSQWDNGSVPNVIPPYWRGYTDNMTWPGAFVTVADMLYTRFGDIQPIEKHYDAMKKWLLHMKENYMKGGLMTRDTYGDWCMPPESLEMIHSNDPKRITESTVISTPFYCYLSRLMAKFAALLGKPEDEAFFKQEITTSTVAFNDKYFNRMTGVYANNTVTANILPLWFGMVPKGLENKVLESIIDKTMNECGGHVSTGVVGIQQLMRCLTEYGRGDLAFKIASNDTYPSWGYMYRNGATTIWELWNGNTADPAMNSGNHVMLLGDLIIWEYEYLGGIRALEPGYSKIQLKPYPIDGLDFVNCAYNSVSGRIESNWKREGNRFEWDFTIPANTTAEVCLPTENGYEVKTFGSGKYHLSSTL